MSPIFEYARDLYREMRGEWYVYLEAEYAAAERGANGSMLNVEGRRQGIDAFDLLTAPWSRVLEHASPELVEWFESHGRPSPSRFEREWFTSWLGEEHEPPAMDAAIPLGTAVRFKKYDMIGWPSLERARIVGHEHPGAGLATLYNLRTDSGATIEMASSDSFTVIYESAPAEFEHKADC